MYPRDINVELRLVGSIDNRVVDVAADFFEEVVAVLTVGVARVGHLGSLGVEHALRTWFSLAFLAMRASCSYLAAPPPSPPLTLSNTHQTQNMTPTLTHTNWTLA